MVRQDVQFVMSIARGLKIRLVAFFVVIVGLKNLENALRDKAKGGASSPLYKSLKFISKVVFFQNMTFPSNGYFCINLRR